MASLWRAIKLLKKELYRQSRDFTGVRRRLLIVKRILNDLIGYNNKKQIKKNAKRVCIAINLILSNTPYHLDNDGGKFIKMISLNILYTIFKYYENYRLDDTKLCSEIILDAIVKCIERDNTESICLYASCLIYHIGIGDKNEEDIVPILLDTMEQCMNNVDICYYVINTLTGKVTGIPVSLENFTDRTPLLAEVIKEYPLKFEEIVDPALSCIDYYCDGLRFGTEEAATSVSHCFKPLLVALHKCYTHEDICRSILTTLEKIVIELSYHPSQTRNEIWIAFSHEILEGVDEVDLCDPLVAGIPILLAVVDHHSDSAKICGKACNILAAVLWKHNAVKENLLAMIPSENYASLLTYILKVHINEDYDSESIVWAIAQAAHSHPELFTRAIGPLITYLDMYPSKYFDPVIALVTIAEDVLRKNPKSEIIKKIIAEIQKRPNVKSTSLQKHLEEIALTVFAGATGAAVANSRALAGAAAATNPFAESTPVALAGVTATAKPAASLAATAKPAASLAAGSSGSSGSSSKASTVNRPGPTQGGIPSPFVEVVPAPLASGSVPPAVVTRASVIHADTKELRRLVESELLLSILAKHPLYYLDPQLKEKVIALIIHFIPIYIQNDEYYKTIEDNFDRLFTSNNIYYSESSHLKNNVTYPNHTLLRNLPNIIAKETYKWIESRIAHRIEMASRVNPFNGPPTYPFLHTGDPFAWPATSTGKRTRTRSTKVRKLRKLRQTRIRT